MNYKIIFKLFRGILQKRMVWTIAVYKLKNQAQILKIDKNIPFYFIGEKSIRKNIRYQATVADPFLFVRDDRLYIFYEIQTDFGVGEIWAQSMDACGAWTSHGLVLMESFHLSYPQVFSHRGQIHMIPEAASSGKVWLYTARAFPLEWHKTRILINEALLDTSIIILDEGIYLLGTTRGYELKVYFASDLDSEFRETGITVSRDKAISRNAGRPLYIENKLYRLAQNCKEAYGQNVALLQIEYISLEKYSEKMVVPDLYLKRPRWMECGYHHVSSASFDGWQFIAVDGMRRDKYVNTFLLAILKLFG